MLPLLFGTDLRLNEGFGSVQARLMNVRGSVKQEPWAKPCSRDLLQLVCFSGFSDWFSNLDVAIAKTIYQRRFGPKTAVSS